MTFFDLEHILTTLGVFALSVFVAWLLVCFFRLVAALEDIAVELKNIFEEFKRHNLNDGIRIHKNYLDDPSAVYEELYE